MHVGNESVDSNDTTEVDYLSPLEALQGHVEQLKSMFGKAQCKETNPTIKTEHMTDNFKMRYPAMSFKGDIVYSRTVFEVEKAANELLNYVETKKRDGGRAIFGFDIEWRPTFRKGVKPGKAAVMQICADKGYCHVMHVFHSGFPQKLQALLGDPTSLKVGVGIAGDASKVFKDHNVSVEALEDLSRLAQRKLGGEPKCWSLSSLTERLISRQVPKPSRIRLGNWEAAPLSKAQLEYAATDAYASWFLYEVLNRFPDADADADAGEKNEEVEKKRKKLKN